MVSSLFVCFFLFQTDTAFAHGSDPNVRTLWQFMNEQKRQNSHLINKVNELIEVMRTQENQTNEALEEEVRKLKDLIKSNDNEIRSLRNRISYLE